MYAYTLHLQLSMLVEVNLQACFIHEPLFEFVCDFEKSTVLAFTFDFVCVCERERKSVRVCTCVCVIMRSLELSFRGLLKTKIIGLLIIWGYNQLASSLNTPFALDSNAAKQLGFL